MRNLEDFLDFLIEWVIDDEDCENEMESDHHIHNLNECKFVYFVVLNEPVESRHAAGN